MFINYFSILKEMRDFGKRTWAPGAQEHGPQALETMCPRVQAMGPAAPGLRTKGPGAPGSQDLPPPPPTTLVPPKPKPSRPGRTIGPIDI